MINKSMKRLNKHLLAMVLTGLMLTASIPVTAAEPDVMPKNPVYSDNGATWNEDGDFNGDVRDKTEWSYIYFGSYPQSEVTDTTLQGKISEKLAEAEKTTGDVKVDGVKYRRIGTGDVNYLRSDWPKVDGENVPYRDFEWKPIKWKVLQVDSENSKLFVVADQALDCQEYNETYTNITWEECTMRKWLNGGTFTDNKRSALTKSPFIETAFNEEQKGIILASEIENKDNPEYHIAGGNNTTDCIFLLSYDDVIKTDYGFCKTFDHDSTSRTVAPTAYANAMGAYRNTVSEWYGGNTWWWLRSPGDDSNKAMLCYGDGWGTLIGYNVSSNVPGVVPALYLNLSSELWSVKEDGGHSGGGGGGETDPDYTAYTITFDGNGVTLMDNTAKTDKDGKVKFPTVERSGYTFKGWYTDKEGGQQVTEANVFTKDMTIYAQWTKNESSSTGGEGGSGTEGGGGTDTDTKTDKPGTEGGQQKAGDDPAKQTEVATPGKVTLGSAKNNKKGIVTIKIKTKKTDPKVDGYEVVSATSKKKLPKVKKAKTFKKATIKLAKLKKGKTYYIKVRAFNKDAAGKNVYGEWSKVIKIKVKK